MLKIHSLLISLVFIGSVQANTLQQMKNELEAQQYAQAATTGLSLLKEQPDDLESQFLTALAFQKNNQASQAIRYYQAIIKQHPELPEPRNNLAIIYQQQGNHEAAVKLLIGSLNTHPAYAAAYKNLTTIYQGLASEAYRKALVEDAPQENAIPAMRLTRLEQIFQPAYPGSAKDDTQLAQNDLNQVSLAAAPTEQVVIEQKPTEQSTTEQANIQLAEPEPEPEPEPQTASTIPSEQQKPVPGVAPDDQLLIKLVKNWANAWSEQDFDQYANAYTDSYKARYRSHAEWLRQRHKRIVRRDRIKVTLSRIEVKSITPNQAVIDFHQAYQSPSYSDKVKKRLRLIRINQQWKINHEVTLAVL